MLVTKIEAARSQLETSIRLFFSGSDPISAHTLASAAWEVLDSISIARGYSSFRSQLLTMVPENQRKGLIKTINLPQNFFKHANNDPDEKLDFDEEATLWALLPAVIQFYHFGQVSPVIAAFEAWVRMARPQLFLPETISQAEALFDIPPGFAELDMRSQKPLGLEMIGVAERRAQRQSRQGR